MCEDSRIRVNVVLTVDEVKFLEESCIHPSKLLEYAIDKKILEFTRKYQIIKLRWKRKC